MKAFFFLMTSSILSSCLTCRVRAVSALYSRMHVYNSDALLMPPHSRSKRPAHVACSTVFAVHTRSLASPVRHIRTDRAAQSLCRLRHTRRNSETNLRKNYSGVSCFIGLTFLLLLERFNPLNRELNPICYFLALLGAHHFLHLSRIRVKLLTFRLLMSYIYIYGAPILDVSRSHTTTQHSR